MVDVARFARTSPIDVLHAGSVCPWEGASADALHWFHSSSQCQQKHFQFSGNSLQSASSSTESLLLQPWGTKSHQHSDKAPKSVHFTVLPITKFETRKLVYLSSLLHSDKKERRHTLCSKMTQEKTNMRQFPTCSPHSKGLCSLGIQPASPRLPDELAGPRFTGMKSQWAQPQPLGDFPLELHGLFPAGTEQQNCKDTELWLSTYFIPERSHLSRKVRRDAEIWSQPFIHRSHSQVQDS